MRRQSVLSLPLRGREALSPWVALFQGQGVCVGGWVVVLVCVSLRVYVCLSVCVFGCVCTCV